MKSIWSETAPQTQFPTLDGDKFTDVLIIGGGMAGILCLYHLRQLGLDALLVEARQIGSGITKNTTAVLTAQHDTFYGTLTKRFTLETAKLYLEANLWAVRHFRELSHSIDCDFEDKPSYIFSRSERLKMQEEAGAVNLLGFPATFEREPPLPFPVAGAVKFPEMAQFHPLKFLSGISQGLPIYEDTFVQKLDGLTAHTNHGRITARRIIVATHYPFIDTHGFFFTKLYQQRSYIIALENAPDLEGTYVEDEGEGLYFRNYKNLLLVGGGDHRTGKRGGGFGVMRGWAARHCPNAREVASWATQDCMSLDGMPYIGLYSKNTPNLYVATGFNEWGMTSSMVSASVLIDLIIEREDALIEVFSPQRSVLHKQLFANLGTTLGDMVLPTTKRCTHLGGALHRNELEHSWDCPCHGSRFDDHGHLIDNPATKDSHTV